MAFQVMAMYANRFLYTEMAQLYKEKKENDIKPSIGNVLFRNNYWEYFQYIKYNQTTRCVCQRKILMVIYKVLIPVKSIFHNPGKSLRLSKFKIEDSFPYYFNIISNI